jgi:hypothetical protein
MFFIFEANKLQDLKSAKKTYAGGIADKDMYERMDCNASNNLLNVDYQTVERGEKIEFILRELHPAVFEILPGFNI